ncbi:MAG: serine/threonine protein kinase, partial [Cyanobacteria bacterium J06632_19]
VYLHELNPPVLHRDIKPSNLICGKDGHIYLIDFGAVQYRAAVEGSTFTVVGTYGYTPIEQFGGRAVAASDIYALGTTLIHLLTGIPPADLPQEDFKIKFADRVNLSPDLIRWLGKAIEPDLKKRFDTAQTALKELQSGIVNDDDSSMKLSQKSYYSKDLVPSHTNVELEKTLDKLTITYPSIEVNYMYLLVAIFLFFGVLITSIFFGVSATIFLLLSYCGTFYIIPEPRNRIFFHNSFFEIYEHNKFIGGGSIKEIENVNLSISDNLTIESWFILIKTQKQTYTFGHGLTRTECIWLVQEINNWLEQN